MGGFDLRFTEADTADAILAQLRRIVRDAGGELQVTASGPATHYPRSHPVAQRFLSVIEEVTGRPPPILHSAGASNGRLYVGRDPQMMVLMSSPCMSGSHGREERVQRSALAPFFEVVWRTIHDVGG